MSSPRDNILRAFKSVYGYVDPLFIRSPGRVNIIGEHTDYNDGLVLPSAINRSIVMGICKNDRSDVYLNALDRNETYDFGLDDFPFEKSDSGWANYLVGAVDRLVHRGRRYDIGGFDCVFSGTIPVGSGLSSSAALAGAVIGGLDRLFELDMDRWEKAKMAREVENEFVGVQCGIMDPFANVFGREGQAMMLDCRSLEYEYIPLLLGGYCLVLCDTGIRRELVSSEYNQRRQQCREGVEALREHGEAIESLRDVDLPMLEKYRDVLDPVVYDRCSYVVEENNRVEAAAEQLKAGRLKEVGEQMNESHRGLSEKYEVSSEELDFLAEEARNIDGVLGSRMMGAGFGGCTINILSNNVLDDFSKCISNRYYREFGRHVTFYRVQADNGTSVLEGE